MVQYLEKYKKNIAIDMRKRGLSYSDIQNKMNVPKSTIAYWIKNIPLTKEQSQKLKNRRIEIAKLNSQKRILKNQKLIKEIEISSSSNIQKISKRELWLMGIILYWKSKNKNDFRNGVRYTSSDPNLIKLFLKWLRDIGGIEDHEISFDIFTGSKGGDSISYWSRVTGFPKKHFGSIYHKKSGFGFLRIKVKSSSMLARQISGWIKGIQSNP